MVSDCTGMSYLHQNDPLLYSLPKNPNYLDDDISDLTCDVQSKKPRVEIVCDTSLHSKLMPEFYLPSCCSSSGSSYDNEEDNLLTQK